MYRAGDEEPLLGVEAKWEREKGDGSSIERSARGTEHGCGNGEGGLCTHVNACPPRTLANLVFLHGVEEILLVGKDEQGDAREPLLLEQLLQLSAGLVNPPAV